jgi:hypothetical protein
MMTFRYMTIQGSCRGWLVSLCFVPAVLAAKPRAGGLRRAVSPFRAFDKARNRRR